MIADTEELAGKLSSAVDQHRSEDLRPPEPGAETEIEPESEETELAPESEETELAHEPQDTEEHVVTTERDLRG